MDNPQQPLTADSLHTRTDPTLHFWATQSGTIPTATKDDPLAAWWARQTAARSSATASDPIAAWWARQTAARPSATARDPLSEWWKNQTGTCLPSPTVRLGEQRLQLGRYDVPALVVPIILCALFIAWKLYERTLPEEVSQPAKPPSHKSTTSDDAEKQNPETKPSKREPSASERTTAWICGGSIMICWAFLLGWPWPTPVVMLSMLAVNALAVSAMCGLYGQGGSKRQALAVSIASVGPLIQVACGNLPPWNWSFTSFSSLMALFTLWPVCIPGDLTEIVYMGSACFLLSFQLRTHVLVKYWPPAGPPPAGSGFHPMPWWYIFAMVSPSFLLGFLLTLGKWAGVFPHEDTGERKRASRNDIVSDLLEARTQILAGAVGMMSSFIPMLLTSYAETCIGLESWMLGVPLRPLSFTPNLAGCLSGGYRIYLIYTKDNGSPHPWRLARSSIDSAGWPITFVLSASLLLMAFEQIRG